MSGIAQLLYRHVLLERVRPGLTAIGVSIRISPRQGQAHQQQPRNEDAERLRPVLPARMIHKVHNGGNSRG